MNELQSKMLSLLKEVDDICRSNNIRFFLYGGTVIGAVRHKGFIPWDDDLDIIFTRDNWNKFREAVKNQRPDRHLSCLEQDDKYYNIWAKYVDPETAYIFPTAICGEETTGCFIDIGILDAAPPKESKRKKMVKWMVDYGEYVNKNYYLTNRNISSRIRNNYFEFLGKIIGRRRMIRYLSNRIQRYNNKPYKQMIQNSSIYPVCWDRRYFDEPPEYVPFEDTTMPIMKDAGTWLRYTYGGDWYMLPDIIGRTGHIGVWTTYFPAKTVENEYAPFLNRKRILEKRRIVKKYRMKAVKYENKIRIANSKKTAIADSILISNQLNHLRGDLSKALNTYRYAEVINHFQLYLEKQFQKRYLADGIAIEIPSEALFAICMALILTGQSHKAAKLIELNYKSPEKAPKSFDEIIRLLASTRELSIAIYDKNDWEYAEELINEWGPRYPHHLDFRSAELYLKVKHTADPKELKKLRQEIRQEELCHPNSSILKKILADICIKSGNQTQAEKNYQAAYQNTSNGILRLEIEEISKQYGFSIVPESERYASKKKVQFAEDRLKKGEEKRVQKIILNLLEEIKNICEKEGISFFLGGYIAEGAEKYGTFFKGCCSAYIVMHPRDRKRFLRAMKHGIASNRKLESFETNRNYPDFSIRYTDTDTLFFNVREEGFYRNNGISITVYFVRPNAGTEIRQKFNTGLYASIEANALKSPLYNYTLRKTAAGIIGKAAMFFLGKKLTKKIAWKLIYSSKDSAQIQSGSIKSFWFHDIPIPTLNFDERRLCSLNGITFPIPVNYDLYSKHQIRKGLKINQRIGIQIGLPYIISTTIPEREYTKRLSRCHLCRSYQKSASRLYRINLNCGVHEKYLQTAWTITKRGLDRLLLWKHYMPLKNELLSYISENDYKILWNILKPYINKIKYYYKYSLPISFDNDILRITWKLMERAGQGKMIAQLLPKMPQRYFFPLRPRLSSELLGEMKTMKNATDPDCPMILDYLKADVANCLYLYADIAKYGASSENMKVWYDTDEQGIRMVVMKYHTSFQVYANRGFDRVEGLLELIAQEKPLGISAREELICAIKEPLRNQYTAESGLVYRGKPIDCEQLKTSLEDCDIAIELARPEDAPEIAKLLFLDEEFRSIYTEESLADELRDRIETGMGRSYIIRDNGAIVAHNATYAESDLFVVISGLMVHPAYRDRDYAYWIDLKSSLEFQLEGKERYFMALKPKIIRWHKFVGTPIAGHYGKLSRIKAAD